MAPVDWTFVTFYFDLPRRQNCSPACRTKAHYLENAAGTLAIPYNLILFCDDVDTETFFLRRRREHGLEDKTVVIRLPEMPLLEYRDHIEENRLIWYPYTPDARNDALYYLLCMCRYQLMLRVLAENPFQTEFFSWINICMQRMGMDNLAHLTDVVETNRRFISTVCMTYHPKALTTRYHRYFEFGRAGLCSGFFTGDAPHMKRFCKAMLAKFRHCLYAGFGHADEQLWFLVYRDHPQWFRVYFGNYENMITNYKKPYNFGSAFHEFSYFIAAAAEADNNWNFLRHGYRYLVLGVPDETDEKHPFSPAIDPLRLDRFVKTQVMRATLDSFLRTPTPTFTALPGEQPYHLLAYVSSLYHKAVFLDIGTRNGTSALALSMNPSNQVHSFDDQKPQDFVLPLHRANIQFHLQATRLLDAPDQFWETYIRDAAVIVMDWHHTGEQEWQFFQFLRQRQFAGVVIWNQVFYSPQMRAFCQKVLDVLQRQEYCDWSNYGHWKGTLATRFQTT